MTNRRRGARMVRAVLDEQQRQLQRRPDPIEVVTAAYALAGKIAGAERCFGDYSTRLRRPSLSVATSTDQDVRHGATAVGAVYYADDIAIAHEVLGLLDDLGDEPGERHNVRDREMVHAAAFMRMGIDFRAIARKFKITAADAEQRLKARSSRMIMGLRDQYPDLFGDDVRVIGRGAKCPRPFLPANERWRTISREAKQRAEALAPTIAEIKAIGVTTLSGIAVELNARSIPTANGGAWAPKQVSRVLGRIGSLGASVNTGFAFANNTQLVAVAA
jgi:hypothetical protein